MNSEKKSYFEDVKLIATTQRDALIELYKTCDPESKTASRVMDKINLLTEYAEDCDRYLAKV